MKATHKSALASAAILALSLAAAPAWAEQYFDHARVISVTPEYDRVNMPRQECHDEYRSDPSYGRSDEHSYGGAIIGGVTGAIVGNQVGKGHGREAATAAGAIAGALVGDRMQNQDSDYARESRPVRRCRNVDNWENRITGYRVEYEYAGRRYAAKMPVDPGRELRVRVSVDPYED